MASYTHTRALNKLAYNIVLVLHDEWFIILQHYRIIYYLHKWNNRMYHCTFDQSKYTFSAARGSGGICPTLLNARLTWPSYKPECSLPFRNSEMRLHVTVCSPCLRVLGVGVGLGLSGSLRVEPVVGGTQWVEPGRPLPPKRQNFFFLMGIFSNYCTSIQFNFAANTSSPFILPVIF